MIIEHWEDFITLLNNLYPVLKAGDKVKSLTLKGWAKINQHRHHDLLQVNIEEAINFIESIKGYLQDSVQKDLDHTIYFLRALNDSPNADWIETKQGCEFWNYHWYDNSCHVKPKPEPVEPVEPVEPIEPVTPIEPMPPLPPKTCEDYKTEIECLTADCYWYDGSCHSSSKITPEPALDPFAEFAKEIDQYCDTIPLTQPVKKTTCITVKNILLFMSDFTKWRY